MIWRWLLAALIFTSIGAWLIQGGGGGGPPPPPGAITFTYDNAKNSSGNPANTLTTYAFPYTTMQGILSEPERFVVWNTGSSSLTSLAVSYSGTNAADFSTAETNCTGTLAVGAYCRVIVNFTPSTTGAESGNLVISATGISNPLPLSGTGMAATVIPSTCATFAGNPSLNANTLYLLGDVTCSQVQFQTKNGTIVQGDCTKYDGTNTVFDGASAAPQRLTNGTDPAYGGTGAINVVLKCFTVQHYGFPGECGSSMTHGESQLDTWNGWLLTNMTLQLSCGVAIGMHTNEVIRNSHITGNLHAGIIFNTGVLNAAAGTFTAQGDAFDNDSISGSACESIGECAGIKAANLQAVPTPPNSVTINGGYFNEARAGNPGNRNAAWCDGCYNMKFSVLNSTFIGSNGGGVRWEISQDSSGGGETPGGTAGDFEHNYFFNNTGGQGQLMAECSDPMTAKSNFVDATSGVTTDLVSGADFRDGCPNPLPANLDWENNIVIFRSTCSAFGVFLCYGGVQITEAISPGTSVMKNNTFYMSGPYNTGTALFVGPDAGGVSRTLGQMQAATPTAWEIGSTASGTLPSGVPSGCTGDGKYPEGCVGSGM